MISSSAMIGLGCKVDVDFGDGAFLCSDQQPACNDGKVCRSGQCVDPNAVTDAAIATDSGADAAPAPVIPTFGTAIVIPAFASPAIDDDPSLTADLTTAVFNSDRSGDRDFWTSTRASTDDPWGSPVLIADLSEAGVDSTISISPDGLTIMFGSNRAGGLGLADLYVSSRASVEDAWLAPVNVTDLNTIDRDQASYISNNAGTVYFDSDRSGVISIYKSKRLGDDEFETPTAVTELNGEETSAGARLTSDQLAVVFHSSRNGDLDLYAATRGSVDQPFSTPQLVSELSVAGVNEEDPWISDDLCTLVYATLDAQGIRQIHMATCL